MGPVTFGLPSTRAGDCIVPMNARTRTVGLVLVVVGMLGCGPSIDETPPQYEPRVCGQPAPVQVLAVDEPYRWIWEVDEVQGRWVVRRFEVELVDDVRAPSFATDTVGPCGEDPVPLSDHLWPLTIGDALYGCDVISGDIYPLDPHDGSRGEKIASSMECEPVGRTASELILLDTTTQRLAIINEQGQTLPTSITFEIPEDRLDRLAPHLNNPLYSTLRISSGAEGARTWVHGADQGLWWLDVADGTHERLFEGVEEFRVEFEAGFVLVLDDEESLPEQPRLQIFVLGTGEIREGPWVDEISSSGGYLAVEQGLYGLEDGSLHPYPAGVDPALGVWVQEGLAEHIGQRLILWDVESGEILVDVPAEGTACSTAFVLEDVVFMRWGMDGGCRRTQLWSYPLDGSEPELAREESAPFLSSWLSVDELLIQPISQVGNTGNLVYENRATGESWLIDRDVAGPVGGAGKALGWGPELEARSVLYHVRGNGRTGLWRSELPR